jgi:hypothetical protein
LSCYVPTREAVAKNGRALNVNDLVVLRSDRSGVDALKVAIHRLPANVSSAVTPAQNTYTFW